MVVQFSKFFTIFTAANEKGRPYFEKSFLAFLGIMGYDVTKSKSFGGVVVYDTRDVGGLADVNFFQNSPEFLGSTNMSDTFQRSEGEHVVLGGIRMHTAVAAGDTDADKVNSVLVPGLAAAELVNGQWSFSVNGVNREKRLPLTTLTRAVENPFSGYYEFPFPVILPGQESLQVAQHYFTNPVTDTIVRVELFGMGLTS